MLPGNCKTELAILRHYALTMRVVHFSINHQQLRCLLSFWKLGKVEWLHSTSHDFWGSWHMGYQASIARCAGLCQHRHGRNPRLQLVRVPKSHIMSITNIYFTFQDHYCAKLNQEHGNYLLWPKKSTPNFHTVRPAGWPTLPRGVKNNL